MSMPFSLVRTISSALVGVAILIDTDPGSAEMHARITAVSGETAVSDSPGRLNGAVGEGDQVKTSSESSCAVLVDDSSIIQFCGQAAVKFRKGGDGSTTIVDVNEGSTRAVVGPRPADAPMEIRTPVAIAQILGTIVSVEVDPQTGDTTFGLEQGKVKIEPRGTGSGGAVELAAGEQVTIRAGQPSGPVEPLRITTKETKPCMDPKHYRLVSANNARSEIADDLLDQVIEPDLVNVDVAAGPGGTVIVDDVYKGLIDPRDPTGGCGDAGPDCGKDPNSDFNAFGQVPGFPPCGGAIGIQCGF